MTILLASAGSADLTPEHAVPLAGSEIRTAPFRGIADRLEADALVLRQDGPPLAFISVDLMFVGRELRAAVLERLGGAISDDALFFAASHTHFAPATDDRRPRLGRMDARYFNLAVDRVSGLVLRLLDGPFAPVTLEYTRGLADHSVNRRLRAAWHLSRRGVRLRSVVAAPNPGGPHDESLHLLRVSAEDRRPVALIWSYACHPVAFPRALEVTAEYPGRVRARLRDALGPRLPILFWQGFAGDVRPPELDRSTSLAARARRLLLGPRFGRFTEGEWKRWADSLGDRVVHTALQGPPEPVPGPVRLRRVARPLADFVQGVRDDRWVTFHRVTFGTGLTVVGISAEVVTEYGAVVSGAFPGSITIPVGYIDEVYGYLPTARMLTEGGYEVEWFLEPFNLDGPLDPALEERCRAALRELASEA